MKATFKVWKDGKESILVEAKDGLEALDIFCQKLGFIDHADYCQQNNLQDSDINMKGMD